MSGLQNLIELFEREKYGILFMTLFELIAITSCLLFVKKDKIGMFFLAYLIFDLITLGCYYYVKLSTSISDKTPPWLVLLNTLISLIELIAYYEFFFAVVRNKKVIKLMRFIRTLFSGIIVIFTATKFRFLTERYSYVSGVITVTEFLFLLIPSFVYFYELFKEDSVLNLSQRPSFWIVTGIFFYAVISVPYFLLDRYVFSNDYEHRHLLDLAFFYTPFSISFIFLTKAFLCKKTLTI